MMTQTTKHPSSGSGDGRGGAGRGSGNGQDEGDKPTSTPTTGNKYRGVSIPKRTGRWQASLFSDGKSTRVGTFDTEEQVARAFDRCHNNIYPISQIQIPCRHRTLGKTMGIREILAHDARMGLASHLVHSKILVNGKPLALTMRLGRLPGNGRR
jgi:hypothetical protein